jgi:hypothetical protein
MKREERGEVEKEGAEEGPGEKVETREEEEEEEEEAGETTEGAKAVVRG